MLFSVPDRVWWLTAAVVTVLFAITVLALPPGPKRAPEALRAKLEQVRRRNRRAFLLSLPPLCAAVALGALFGAEPTPVVLFLYSVAVGSLPVALLPVRHRLHRSYFAQLENPGHPIDLDTLSTVWICGVISVSLMAASLLVAWETYEPGGS
ncbi:hypothetical protein ACSMX9_18040 [Streptomyces sp. LE64]|uniref:hypothetical protein n=1 Tax=Streptomyces sp. LE64 TaxID=3448653 RepID=UPI004042F1E5